MATEGVNMITVDEEGLLWKPCQEWPQSASRYFGKPSLGIPHARFRPASIRSFRVASGRSACALELEWPATIRSLAVLHPPQPL
jgi:hypothetical protein